jgi:DNA polymerase I-like protein with 3'-5' exonuclease and polymerase domains
MLQIEPELLPSCRATRRIASLDTEAFYDKDYSVSDLGPTGYCSDPRFDCYLVTIKAVDGFEFAGHPKVTPWEELRGALIVMWNQGFDVAVLRRLVADGLAPAWVLDLEFVCAANLAVYLGFGRSLAQATEQAFGIKVSKAARTNMKGRRFEDLTDEAKAVMIAYALDDARHTINFWREFSGQWPEHERRLSAHTYAMGANGLPVDVEQLSKDIELLERALFAAKQRIPWRNDYAILSPKALAEECRKVGIEPPVSLAKTSEECAAWEAKYGDTYPWVAAMRDYRRVNALLEKFKTARDRLTPDNRMPYSLLYGGAHTMRWSGSGGWNVQNMPRAPFYFDESLSITPAKTDLSINLREIFRAPAGKRLIVADYAQIEARILPWLAGDIDMLALIRQGYGVYEAYARKALGWTGGPLKKSNPQVYQLAKILVLGLGFGCGWHKFISLAKIMLDAETYAATFAVEPPTERVQRFIEYQEFLKEKGFTQHLAAWKRQDTVTQWIWVNAWYQVDTYRRSNPKITALWKRLMEDFKKSVGGMHTIELPSGRELRYFNVEMEDDSPMAQMSRGAHRAYVTPGTLAENAVQATARDIVGHAILRVDDAGYPIILHAHDEIVGEVDETDDCGPQIANIMTTPPPWARTLPLGVEWSYETRYTK